jgi:hypothetical protein
VGFCRRGLYAIILLLSANERVINATTMTPTNPTRLIAYTNRIAEACAGVWPVNYILAGVTQDGKFLMQDIGDDSGRLAADDLADQCTFRAGSTAQAIKARIEFWEGLY